jgi:hypothetical protein
MRYEDWIFREAEVRLSEHSELRSALQLRSVTDYTTLYRFLTRLQEDDVVRVMHEIVRRMPGRWRSPTTVAVDATGLVKGAVSSYFIRHVEYFSNKQRSWKHWIKWLLWSMWIARSSSLRAHDKLPGTARPRCPCWWLKPSNTLRLAACWPTPNSTRNATTPSIAIN